MCVSKHSNEEDLIKTNVSSDENVEMYRHIFNVYIESLLLIHPTTKNIIEVNNSACNLYGYTHDELLKLNFSDIIEGLLPTEQVFKEKSNHIIDPVYYHKKKDGTIFPVEIKTSSFVMDNQKVFLCIVNDITERERSDLLSLEKDKEIEILNQKINVFNLKLIESEKNEESSAVQIQAVIEGKKDSILVFDKNYSILYINLAFQTQFLKEFSVFLEPGMNLLDSHFIERRPIWKLRYDKTLTNQQFTIEDTFDKGDTKVCIQLSFDPVIQNDQVVGGSCFGRDITEIKNAEEFLKGQMRDLVESQRIAHIGTWRLNVLTNEVVWSKELYKMYGFNPKLPVPPYTEHMKLFTPESWNKLSKLLELTRTSGIPYELELRTVVADGSNGWMWVRGEAERDSEGNIIAIWGAAQDITERKRVEEKLRISERRFYEVVRNLNAGVVIHAPDSSIMKCNERASKLLGLSVDQLLGKVAIDKIWKFFDEDKSPLPFDQYPINLILSTKKPLENKLIGVYQAMSENFKWLLVNGAPIISDNGEIQEVAISFVDFTEVKNSRNQILASEEQYRLLTTQMQLGQALHEIICDEQGKPINYRFISVNSAFERLTGLKKEDIIGKTVLDVIPNIEKFWIERYGEVALTGKVAQFENYSAELGRHYSVAAYSPKIGHFAVVIDDITERKDMVQQLHNEKELFKTTLISVGDGVISTDTSGNVLIMNKVSEHLTGWTQEEAVGKPIEEVFNIVNEFTKEKSDNPVVKVLLTKEIIELDSQTLLISKDGIETPIEDSASPIIDAHGNIAGVVLVFRDYTGKKKNLDDIKYLSFHDYLTGLYNRRYYETELVRIDTNRNWPLTIVLGDVNGLKLINDSFGHLIGDKLLKKVSETIKAGCRSDDIIARMGGDEFAILLPKTDNFEATFLINRLNDLLKKETIEGVEVSVSFGFATKENDSDEIDTIFKKAEDAMYRNKLYEGPSIRGRVIDNIIDALNNKSQREQIHSRHVSELCQKMGKALDMQEIQIKELKAFGLLHDIGKIAISDKILNKTDKLTDNEWIEMKSHAETGYRILSTNSDMKEIAEYALAHHERWDGKGYPKGLKGEEIPLPARICCIADAYDAMISKRSYKPSLDKTIVLSELRNNSGTQFDPKLIQIFIEKVIREDCE